jgi:hypothetical protein
MAALLAAFCLAAAQPLSAKETGVEGGSATFFFDATFGFNTYKSEMVVSNDTGTALTYSLGGYAGQARVFGFRYKADASTVGFKLNDSSVATTWEDTTLRYRWGNVYMGVVFGHVSMKAKKAAADYIDVAGKGTGANAGLLLPVGRVGLVNLDYTTVSISELKNGLADSGDVTMGARADIDVIGSFNVTAELLDVLVGYQQRSYQVTVEESYKEEYSITYAGIRLSLYF